MPAAVSYFDSSAVIAESGAGMHRWCFHKCQVVSYAQTWLDVTCCLDASDLHACQDNWLCHSQLLPCMHMGCGVTADTMFFWGWGEVFVCTGLGLMVSCY